MPALTDKAVKAARPEPRRREIPDGIVGSLYLIVQPSGVKSFAVRYQLKDTKKKVKQTLGRYPQLSLAAARDEARLVLDKVQRGIDPRGKDDVKARSFKYVFDDYVRVHCNGLRSKNDRIRIFERDIIPVLGDYQINKITQRQITQLVDSIRCRPAPILANRALVHLKHFFNWVFDREEVNINPALRIKQTTEASRDRVLQDNEIRLIWSAFDQKGWPFGHAAKLLLLTGQRKGEVSGIRWKDLDLVNKVWHLPAELTKAGRSHDVPLSTFATSIIQRCPCFTGEQHVFPAARGGQPIVGWNTAKKKFDTVSGVMGWRLHDLRRTAATGMVRLGVSVNVVSLILNHSTGGSVTAIYNRHSYNEEKRDALERWGEHVRKLTSLHNKHNKPPEAEKVVDYQ